MISDMSKNSPATDFPYPFPAFLSPVLRILADGHEHGVEAIRERIAREFALTHEQLLLRRRVAFPTVFVNKVALAFMRLVIHKAIVAGSTKSGSYRITLMVSTFSRDTPKTRGSEICKERCTAEIIRHENDSRP